MNASAKEVSGISERQIIVTRLINAPLALVFKAFHEPKHITNWWGPNGFRTTTHEMQFRVGGRWKNTMHGPDGTDYDNFSIYTDIRENELIAYDHFAGEGGPLHFQAEISFKAEGEKTRVTLQLTAPTKDERDAMAKFGAIEGGEQTLARLEAHLSGKATA